MFRVLTSAILIVFIILFLFTLFSRLDIFNLFGGAIVYSGSMEPSIRRWDLVLFMGVKPSKGDVVVYCLTHSFCVVHRYIGDCPNGNCIITKGDANLAPDPFLVSLNMVKGVAIYVIPRELWISLFIYAVALAILDIVKTRLVGIAAAIVYTTILLFILFVYGFTQPPPELTHIEFPVLYLSKIGFSHIDCTISIGYTGVPRITDAEVYIDGVKAFTQFNETFIVATIPHSITKTLSWSNAVDIQVVAILDNGMGRLRGRYSVKLYGEFLEVKALNGSLFIRNPNCFPIPINITFIYAYRVGDIWRNTSSSFTIDGFREVVINPPDGSRYVYADIRYRFLGVDRWMRTTVRYG